MHPPVRRSTFWERQSLLGKLAISVFVWPQLAGALGAYFFANIIPSPLTLKVGLVGGAALAFVWAGFLEMANKGRVWDLTQRSQRLMSRIWLRAPLSACFGFMFAYSSLTWAYPWLINEIAGKPGEQSFVVVGWHEGGRKSCSGPDVGHSLLRDAPRALCVSADAESKMRPGTRLRIEGPATRLGINTQTLYALPAPPQTYQEGEQPK
jgi:hypothetical protein